METLKLKLFTYPLEEHMPGGLENKLLTLNRASLIPELMILTLDYTWLYRVLYTTRVGNSS